MDIAEIQRRLAKPAVKLLAGGFKPTHQLEESWIGKVSLYRQGEGIPQNDKGQMLIPYAQFYLPALPFISPQLENVRVLTLFISEQLPEPLEKMGNNWVIREYGDDDVLIRQAFPAEHATPKPFPLRAEYIAEDFPLWDGGGVPRELEREILKLEQAEEIDSYYDIVTHEYGHKMGGYPSYCQPGIDFDEDFEFVFQISSDEKINLNVVDSGSLMFWKNKRSGEWAMYYDFY